MTSNPEWQYQEALEDLQYALIVGDQARLRAAEAKVESAAADVARDRLERVRPLRPHRARPVGGYRWTHPSVKLLAKEGDPFEVIVDRAQRVVFEAVENGWGGPPFDVATLADHVGLDLRPTSEVEDARLISTDPKPMIEFNPSRPARRIRYSIAHEIGHSLFSDHAEAVRHRSHSGNRARNDEWQLEMLCNIAAAELLMPAGSFPHVDERGLSIEALLAQRERYNVSTEAFVLRFVHLTPIPCAAVVASPTSSGSEAGYRLDYVAPSRTWFGPPPIVPGTFVRNPSAFAEVAAVGFTYKEDDPPWVTADDSVATRVECVGIAPFPSQSSPRVLSLVTTSDSDLLPRPPTVTYLIGNATSPVGAGRKLLVHVVNDKARTWHGGFAAALRAKWPQAQTDFSRWVSDDGLRLGSIHRTRISDDLDVVHLVAQHGYGRTPKRRLRYEALQSCLHQVGEIAQREGASVHMPRIGTGQAGGNWEVVVELIRDELVSRWIPTFVYDLKAPRIEADSTSTPSLFD